MLTGFCFAFVAACACLVAPDVCAHEVSPRDAELIAGKTGIQFQLYAFPGAKHMVTGYDHLLFLAGVVFYLRDVRQVAVFVTLFALGHSITLIFGVLAQLGVSPYLIDAIIGLSVAYKGFDNLHGFQTLLGSRPDEKLAVFIFGLFHGLGLATKLQQLGLAEDGLLLNLLSFNLGVELGQLVALLAIVIAIRGLSIDRGRALAVSANVLLMLAGFSLMAYQLARYFGAA